MKHIILAVSYRAELLEKEMKALESRVRFVQFYCKLCTCIFIIGEYSDTCLVLVVPSLEPPCMLEKVGLEHNLGRKC